MALWYSNEILLWVKIDGDRSNCNRVSQWGWRYDFMGKTKTKLMCVILFIDKSAMFSGGNVFSHTKSDCRRSNSLHQRCTVVEGRALSAIVKQILYIESCLYNPHRKLYQIFMMADDSASSKKVQSFLDGKIFSRTKSDFEWLTKFYPE